MLEGVYWHEKLCGQCGVDEIVRLEVAERAKRRVGIRLEVETGGEAGLHSILRGNIRTQNVLVDRFQGMLYDARLE